MKSLLLSFLIIPSILIASGNPDKIMKLKKINLEVKIDGYIDEAWSLADSVADFIQYTPYHGEDQEYSNESLDSR